MDKLKTTRIKTIETYGAVFGIILGTILHFSYDWVNMPWAGVFSAVNESPWEHLKLFIIPVIIFLILESYFIENKTRLFFAKSIQLVFGVLFIITFYYTYTGALGIESIFLDIGSFFAAVIISYYISSRVITSKDIKTPPSILSLSVILIILMTTILTTYCPPHLPIFQDQNSKTYGVTR